MPRDFLFPGDVCSSVLLDFSIDTIMSLESQGNISASFSVCAFYSIFLSRSMNCDVSVMVKSRCGEHPGLAPDLCENASLFPAIN